MSRLPNVYALGGTTFRFNGVTLVSDEPLTEKNIEKRRDDALRRALSTPPKPKQESVKREDKPKKEKPAK
jgi:hypothetical protein